MAQQFRPTLQSLPLEILDLIAFELVAFQPLGPPSDILPLLCTSSHFQHALSPGTNPVLFARIFRHKFDTRAIERRAFTPSHVQCVEQLVHYCRTMQVLRSGDVYVRPRGTVIGGYDNDRSAVDAMFTAFMMMLEDDGKNARQLQEWAFADVFVERFLRRRLYENRERNDGWPLENSPNSCALWLMWMFTSEEKLRNESEAQREQMIQLLLPFVMVSLRYASSEAPPHFYNLPLTSTLPTAPQSITSPHGSYPVYPPPGRNYSQVHFDARTTFSPPLAAPAAKLLYFARRELRPLPIPPHFAQNRAELHARNNYEIGPTVDDMNELNWSWTARLPMGKKGHASDVWDASPSASTAEDNQTTLNSPMPPWSGKAPHSSIAVGKSRCWDADWWRLRLCGDPRRSHPRIRYGRVYVPGCMDGLWVGRMLVSAEGVTNSIMMNAAHPAPGVLNDLPPFTMQAPLYMRLHEAHGVQGELAATIPAGDGFAATGNGLTFDEGITNAWFPGRTGGVRVVDLGETGRGRASEGARRVLVEVEGGRGGKGVYRCWRFGQPGSGEHEEREWEGYVHDEAVCEDCQERVRMLEKAKLAEAMERERWFQSVGLGMDEAPEDEEEEDDDDEVDEEEGSDESNEDEESSSDDEGQNDEGDTADSEWDGVSNANEQFTFGPDGQEIVYPTLPRAHNKRKVKPCDGIKEILLFGETDERHAMAWSHSTYYGRVRPWDGLIGILSKPRDEESVYLFFYGYLVGGKNFVGNWRINSADPTGPVWESAFTMSRRDDD